MNNKRVGTNFEREFAGMLSKHGFWAHCIKDNTNGQPFDVIAAKNGKTFVFDCKDCQGKTFQLSRMEENQREAMKLWQETGNSEGIFSLRFHGRIYLLGFNTLERLHSTGRKQISEKDCLHYGKEAERWLSCV